jgi:hypothetical protein
MYNSVVVLQSARHDRWMLLSASRTQVRVAAPRGADLELDLGPMQAAALEANTAIAFDIYRLRTGPLHSHVVCGPRSLPSRTILFDPWI